MSLRGFGIGVVVTVLAGLSYVMGDFYLQAFIMVFMEGWQRCRTRASLQTFASDGAFIL